MKKFTKLILLLIILIFVIVFVIIALYLNNPTEKKLQKMFGSVKIENSIEYKNGKFILYRDVQGELKCVYYKRYFFGWRYITNNIPPVRKNIFKYITVNIIPPDPRKGVPAAIYGEKVYSPIVSLVIDDKKIDLSNKNIWFYIKEKIMSEGHVDMPNITAFTEDGEALKIYPDYSGNILND